MTAARDYVERGTDRMPEGMRKPNALAYISVYLRELTSTETGYLGVLDAFLDWNTTAPRYAFVLEALGKLLGQPRPDGFNDTDYRNVLVARSIARASDSSLASITKLVAHLATLNGGVGAYSITAGPPEHWHIIIYDVSLTQQWSDLYARLIFDAIGVTDSFDLTLGNASTAVYDDEDSLYDISLYT